MYWDSSYEFKVKDHKEAPPTEVMFESVIHLTISLKGLCFNCSQISHIIRFCPFGKCTDKLLLTHPHSDPEDQEGPTHKLLHGGNPSAPTNNIDPAKEVLSAGNPTEWQEIVMGACHVLCDCFRA
jgi:hypothetical protein